MVRTVQRVVPKNNFVLKPDAGGKRASKPPKMTLKKSARNKLDKKLLKKHLQIEKGVFKRLVSELLTDVCKDQSKTSSVSLFHSYSYTQTPSLYHT